jgi:hypothetical protein
VQIRKEQTLTINEFKTVEAAIERMLKDQYLEESDKIEDCINDVRTILKSKKVRIENQEDHAVKIKFPTTFAAVETKKRKIKPED